MAEGRHRGESEGILTWGNDGRVDEDRPGGEKETERGRS